MSSENSLNRANVFITCLIDNFYPDVGMSMMNVLEKAGTEPHFCSTQTCCGQPAFNSGFYREAREVAKNFLEIYNDSPAPVVCPSGSCTTMIKVFYRELFKNDSGYSKTAEDIASNTYEFTDFLVNILKKTDFGAEFHGRVTYHDSCHMLRELDIHSAPRKLINAVKGTQFVEMEMHDACCGFGGSFSVKLPHVSTSILEEKVQCALDTKADVLVSSDMGCLMNINGYINRHKLPLRTMHIAQLLDNNTSIL